MQRIICLNSLVLAHEKKMIDKEGNFLHTQIMLYTTCMDDYQQKEQCTVLAEIFHRYAKLKLYELTALLDYVMHTAHDMQQNFLEMLSSSEIFEIMAFIKEKREPLFHTDSYEGHRLRLMSLIILAQTEKLSGECRQGASN